MFVIKLSRYLKTEPVIVDILWPVISGDRDQCCPTELDARIY